jgi:hypothetical protein
VQTLELVRDTAAPTLSISAVAGDNVVNAVEKAAGVVVSGSGNAEAGQVVTVLWGSASQSATVGSNGSWQVLFGAADVPADALGTQVLANVSDAAGNAALQASRSVRVDTAAPTVVINTLSMTWEAFWKAVTSPRVVASSQLSFGASLIAALVNLFFGTILAWVLVRYQFFGKKILDAFSAQNLQTDIVLTAMDSDVIQQYVALGLGVGIVASMAIGPNSNQNLKALAADHLFAPNTTRVAVRRGAYLRAYTLEFILQLAPKLKRAEILAAV